MFQEIVDQVKACNLQKYDRFIYYLERHIPVDREEYGPIHAKL